MEKKQMLASLFIMACLSVAPARADVVTLEGEKYWEPGKGVDRETFIRCRGIPCDDWDRRQSKMIDLRAQEMPDSQKEFYSEADQVVKEKTLISKEGLEDIDLDGCEWLSETDIDDVLEIENTGVNISTIRRRRRKADADINEGEVMWPLPIVYKFGGGHSNKEMTKVRGAFSHIEAQTCIRFLEIKISDKYEKSHLVITNDYLECHSWVGRRKEPYQILNLMENCLRDTGKIVHEIMHALGMWHEHQRSDRDHHIEIDVDNLRNIHAQYLMQETDNMGLPYDYGSVMHYSWNHGALNSKRHVITPKHKKMKPYFRSMGQRTGLSFFDAKILNKVYCSDVCQHEPPKKCRKRGYQDPNHCEKCKCLPAYSGDYCEKLAPSSKSCGGEIYVDDVSFINSPSYPDGHYRNHVECTWRFRSAVGRVLEASFVSPFTVYSQDKVCFHWVEIMYKDKLDYPGPRFCGTYTPTTVLTSDNNEMIVMLRANYTISSVTDRLGFKLQITSKPKNMNPEEVEVNLKNIREIKDEKDFSYTCSFEERQKCQIIQDDHDFVDWIVASGPTPSRSTGPKKAQDGKNYLLFEASIVEPGDFARVALPPVPTKQQYCLTFWYSMYGRSMGSLIVEKQVGDSFYTLWSKRGEQGQPWKNAMVVATLEEGDMFVFHAVRGNSYTGDIAIDNIDLRNC